MKISFFLLLSFLMANTSKAATCTVGETGKTRYNSSIYEFCDGANWKSMKGLSVASCIAGDAGKMRYNSNEYQFCDGANWFSMKQGQVTTCAAGDAGKKRYTGGAMQFCDGSHWYAMAAPSGGAANGYFVITNAIYDGNLGGISGANAKCLTDLTNNNWMGKSNATVDAAHVRAFICDDSTCNNLLPSTTYHFASAVDPLVGGTALTTNASGLGPGDNANWSGSTYFGNPTTNVYWTGRAAGSSTQWPATQQVGGTCTNWSVNTNTGAPYFGGTSATDTQRWSYSLPFAFKCNAQMHLACIVDP